MTTHKTKKGGRMRKRGRTSYSPQVLAILEEFFKKNPYLNATVRGYLCQLLGYDEDQIKIWYQNRRMRLKKECFKQEGAAAAAKEDAVSSSVSDENRRIAAQLRLRNRKRSERTSSGSSPTFPLNYSMDKHEDKNLSASSTTNLPSIPHTILPPPPSNVDVFQAHQPNYRNMHELVNHSASDSMLRGNIRAPPPPPRQMPLYHSCYSDFQVPRRPQMQFPDSYQGFGQNSMNQNQGVSHSPPCANRMESGSMWHDNAENSMYRVTSHTNSEYRMSYDHRNNPGRMYPNAERLHYPMNSYHSAYTRQDQNDFNLGTDFSRLRCIEMSSPGSALQGNPYDWKHRNGVKVEFPRQNFSDENSGFSQHSSHYVQNEFNANQNFPTPGITANTYPPHSNMGTSFNQASVYYPSQTRDMHTTAMHQTFSNQKQYLSNQNQFLESLNMNLSGCSTNETNYPTVKSDEGRKQRFPGFISLDKSVNACHETPDKYMDCISSGASEPSLTSCDGIPKSEMNTLCNISEESGIPSWDQIFTEPLRKLEELNDI